MPVAEDASPESHSESGNSSAWSPVYGGGAKLDSDTINYIHRIYCRECRMEEERRKMQQQQDSSSSSSNKPASPQNSVEEASLHQSMDKNKESLKRKLMLRRSVVELAEQGIYPPLKTPPAYAEERKKLELARNRDLLRQKIQQRPNREALVQQHILEDNSTTVDRSLQEKQRLLKRARLQDSLSDRLAHRPGPLELVEGNILQTDPELKDAIKDGTLRYHKTTETSDGTQVRHFVFDGSGSPSEVILGSPQGDSSDHSLDTPPATKISGVPSPPDITPLVQKLKHQTQGQIPFGQTLPPITSQSFVPLSSLGQTAVVSSGPSLSKNGHSSSSNGNSSKLARMKKPKPKSSQKAKVIKFHEYKGPPNMVKTQSLTLPPTSQAQVAAGAATDGTAYNIMLQQQQLFLQWQLEFQQKNLQFILPSQQQKLPDGQQPPTPQPPPLSQTPTPQPTPAPTPPIMSHPSPAPTPEALVTMVNNNNMNPPSVNPPSVPPSNIPVSAVLSPPIHNPPSVNPPSVNPPSVSPQPLQQVMPVANNVSVPQQVTVMPARQQNLGKVSTVAVATTPASIPAQTQPPSNSPAAGTVIVAKKLNFDEMKVADFKAELKRRNLPVSGTKTQLMERLKGALESASVAAMVGNAGSGTATAAQITEVPIQSPPSVQSVSSIQPFTPQSHVSFIGGDGSSMTTGTPPVSPSSDLNTSFSSVTGPMSPENSMDTSQGPVISFIVNQTGGHQAGNNIPMSIDSISRPPSVVPMDVESVSSTGMVVSSVDQTINPQPQFIKLPLTKLQKTHLVQGNKVTAPQPQAVIQAVPKGKSSKTKGKVAVQQQAAGSQAPQIQVQTSTSVPQQFELVHQNPVLATSELVRQQQQQIEELRRQLKQSELKLQAAQQHKNQSKGSSQSKKKSGKGKDANRTSTAAATVAEPKVAPAVQQTIIQLTPPSSVQATATVTSTTTIKSKDVKAVLSNFLQSHSNLNIGQPKVLAVSTPSSGHQPIIIVPHTNSTTVVENKVPVTHTTTLNGVTAPSSRAASVPNSPVNQGKLHRSATNPFFTTSNSIPMKEPPKYDEAIKNKQNLLLQQQQSAPEPATSQGVLPVKSQAMDDVLEILIRNGELPPSAAQEPPPTPKTTQTTSVKSSTVTSSGFSIQQPVINTFTLSSVPQCIVTLAQPPVSSGVTSTAMGQSMTVTTQSIQVPQVSPVTRISTTTCDNTHTIQNLKDIPPPIQIIPVISSSGENMDDTSPTAGIDISTNLDFNLMDWTETETNMVGTFELPDGLDTPSPLSAVKEELSPQLDDTLVKSPVQEQECKPDMTSEVNSNMNPLDLGDIDMTDTSNLEVSDWLDIIMPGGSGLTPLCSNAPVSFPADPILTPKPHEFLDLFNMEESDLITPTELKQEPMFESLEAETSRS